MMRQGALAVGVVDGKCVWILLLESEGDACTPGTEGVACVDENGVGRRQEEITCLVDNLNVMRGVWKGRGLGWCGCGRRVSQHG